MTKLALSTLACAPSDLETVLAHLQKTGYSGVEIVPTLLFGARPYERTAEAASWAHSIREHYGLEICSMQSIWYGRTENIFKDAASRAALEDYTRQAVLFAEAISCPNLVFGCPKNRDCESTPQNHRLACEFFTAVGDFAAAHGLTIALEPNPAFYGTRFLNNSAEAASFLGELNNPGLALNYDLGAVIGNAESLEELGTLLPLIRHVHLSEPRLLLLQHRALHTELLTRLQTHNYCGFVSIEMAAQSLGDVLSTVDYLASLAERTNCPS